MMLTIYADVLFILNFMVDFLLLRATGFLVRLTPSKKRLYLSATFGAFYAVVATFYAVGSITFFLSLLTAFCMIGICYGFRRFTLLLKSVAVFFLISFLCAGICFLFCTHSTAPFFLTYGAIYADVNVYMLLTAFFLATVLMHFVCGYIRKRRIKSGYLYQVSVEKDGKKIECIALFDTGNFLTDPLSQRDVMIAEWSAVKELFAQNTLEEAVVACPGDFLYIPCRSIGASCGMFAFCPDAVRAEKLCLPDALYIGITETALDREGSYQMILPNSATEVAERMML